MHPGIQIRLGRPSDTKSIAVLATQVWLHTYATTGVTTDIADYVLSELTPRKYLGILQDRTSQLLVAGHGHNLVGFAVIKVGAPCPEGAIASTELQTLYVQEHFHGRGIGKTLLQAAENWANANTVSPLWLSVNAHNTGAIAFYRHEGYTKVGTSYFSLGEHRHENHLLVLRDTCRQARQPDNTPHQQISNKNSI